MGEKGKMRKRTQIIDNPLADIAVEEDFGESMVTIFTDSAPPGG